MTYDLEEQEQLEAIKAWWAKYGNLVLTLITVTLLVIASWQWWNWYQRNQAAQAASVFEALQTAAESRQTSQLLDASQRLQDKFASTAYAPRGALVAATALQQAGDAAAARTRLQWVIDGKDAALAPVARLRLAALLIDEGKPAEALPVLQGTAPAGFEALFADRRGDVYFARGELQEAARAWQEALQHMGPADPLASVVQLKIEALAQASAGGAA